MMFEFNLNGHRRGALAGMVATLLLGSAGTVNAKPQAQPSIVGTWVARGRRQAAPDGSRVPEMGPSPHGLCLFTSDGYYSLQFYRSDRLKFASGDKASGTPEEYKDAFVGQSVSFGRYDVDPVKHVISFHREGNGFPNVEGATGVDPYELNGDTLTWKVAARKDGSVPITVLRRAK